MNPLVSIVIPVYRGSNYLAEAIDSALAQTYKNIEIIVVNDGSPDDGATERVALSYGDKIRYFYKENGGVSTALNFGIKQMKGEYFSWLSHDDLYFPEKIEKQVAAIRSKKDIVLCSGILVDESGKKIPHNPKLLDGNFTGAELFRAFLDGYILNGLGFLIPRHVFDAVGGMDTSMRFLQDLDLWLRIMWHDYNFVCQPEKLVKSRVHKNQVTNLMAPAFIKDSKALAAKHIHALESESIYNKVEVLKCYMLFFYRGNHIEQAKHIKKMLMDAGCTNLMPFTCFRYRCAGRLKVILRSFRDFVYKLKGQR